MSDAESDARGAREVQDDPRLAAVVDAWPMLPERVKAAVVALIDEASGFHAG